MTERTIYLAKPIVCDTGVYACYKNPPSESLLLVCKSSANAQLICDIMNADAADEVYDFEPLDTANANVIGYIDDKYQVRSLVINQSDDLLSIDLLGSGRLSHLDKTECNTVIDLKGTIPIRISRKILGITLWSKLFE